MSVLQIFLFLECTTFWRILYQNQPDALFHKEGGEKPDHEDNKANFGDCLRQGSYCSPSLLHLALFPSPSLSPPLALSLDRVSS